MLEMYILLGMHLHSYAEHNKLINWYGRGEILCGMAQLGDGDITFLVHVCFSFQLLHFVEEFLQLNIVFLFHELHIILQIHLL
jgi:hypothetical protein